ncbi:glucan endo-1,3-alpha-glucosidase [Marchantia polymorpha subsp. ruderalis]|uniref:Mutanase n=2 Tax=Marchantia polymorpha TaxID=3197 RepID=A0AAF6B516_MARPO|nr:hypothetical protein MARPO_0066s0042 [Marchantia polymorpha]BBN07100.1 hypothetical protein Mp_4g01010 [Marchantia polymorpha subsp. ruderalis]|eukprot:PTQ36084.1 hypothetical protein MARPO_0066s0042 [Marchantia polymorpha]
MKSPFVLAILSLALMLGQRASMATAQKMVFAHYLIYAPDSIDTYKREISLAQSKGIDAFALNTNVYRKNLFDNIYEAARQVGSSFKLFFSADIHVDGNGRLSPANIVSMLADYRTHPNQLFYNNKALFTSWLGNNNDYWSFYGYANSKAAWDDIFSQAGGKSLYFFIPFFPTDGSYYGVKGIVYDTFGSTVDGYFGWESSAWNYLGGNFDTPGTTPGDASSLTVSNDLGKTYMAAAAPWFFKNLGGTSGTICCVANSPSCNPAAGRDANSECPCHVKGNYQGPGLWVQHWGQIIANPPPLVEIVSWNDWIEGHYIAPGYSSGAAASSAYVDVAGFPHQAYLELGQHYIQWYKTGSEPIATKDSVYLFYYTMPKSTSIPGVCGILHADKLSDVLYGAVILSPGPSATVTLHSGGSTHTQTVTQGVSVIGMGFSTGTQSLTFTRGSTTFTLTGAKPIINSGMPKYDFNVYSTFCADVQNGHCGS